MLFQVTLKTAQANGKMGRTVFVVEASNAKEATKIATERAQKELDIPYKIVGTPVPF